VIVESAVFQQSNIQINCVLMRHINMNEMGNFLEMMKEVPIDIRFIEVMPFDDNNWKSDTLVAYTEALDHLQRQVRKIDS